MTSIGSVIDDRSTTAPDHVFLRYGDEEITFAALARRIYEISNALTAWGVRRGDRVATLLPNGPNHVVLFLALMRSGVVWVPVNYHQRGAGLEYLLHDCDPARIVTHGNYASLVAEAAPDLSDRVLVVPSDELLADTLIEASGTAGDAAFSPTSVNPGDIAVISYTSGTTGPPKGVLMTERMIRQCALGMKHVLPSGAGAVLHVWEPLHHNAGNQVPIYALMERATLALHSRFSASRFWEQVVDSDARYVHYIGGVLQILLKQPAGPLERRHAVQVAWGGGCPADIWSQVRERFGVRIHEVWGMTETASITTANIGGPEGSIGRPLPHVDVRIRRADGTFAGPGEVGEIVVRSLEEHVLTPGYFRNEEATAELYDGEWLQTGDKAYADEHDHFYFLGRLKDSVRRRGENVSAWEVERVLDDHPAIVRSAIVGVSTDIGEEDIKAYVQVREDREIDFAELSEWCRERMAYYQIPRYFEQIGDFQVTPTERIRKELLSRSVEGAWDRDR